MNNIELLRKAAAQITPEQLAEFKAGRLILPEVIAALVMERHGITELPQPQNVIAVPPRGAPPSDQSAWLASQDAYDAARAQADAAGASPANLNALLQPEGLTLPCGLTMLPLTLSGYIFLEAVQSPFVNGGDAPTPTDIMHLALALICPEKAAAVLTFGEDFQPAVVDPESLRALAMTYGGVLQSADVRPLMAHATAQFKLMFPPRQGGDEGDPLTLTPAAQAAGA